MKLTFNLMCPEIDFQPYVWNFSFQNAGFKKTLVLEFQTISVNPSA